MLGPAAADGDAAADGEATEAGATEAAAADGDGVAEPPHALTSRAAVASSPRLRLRVRLISSSPPGGGRALPHPPNPSPAPTDAQPPPGYRTGGTEQSGGLYALRFVLYVNGSLHGSQGAELAAR